MPRLDHETIGSITEQDNQVIHSHRNSDIIKPSVKFGIDLLLACLTASTASLIILFAIGPKVVKLLLATANNEADKFLYSIAPIIENTTCAEIYEKFHVPQSECYKLLTPFINKSILMMEKDLNQRLASHSQTYNMYFFYMSLIIITSTLLLHSLNTRIYQGCCWLYNRYKTNPINPILDLNPEHETISLLSSRI